MVGPQLPPRLAFLHHESREQHADLIAVERRPFAVRISGDGHGDADAIGIRIAGHDQVGPGLPGFGDRRFQSARILRVRHVVRDIGEIGVGLRCDARTVTSEKPAILST